MQKLSIWVFSYNARDWVKSYLTDRFQLVKVYNDCSHWAKLPQGYIVGPLLFNILISDMRQFMEFVSSHGYADDTQIKLNTTVEIINEAMDYLYYIKH